MYYLKYTYKKILICKKKKARDDKYVDIYELFL